MRQTLALIWDAYLDLNSRKMFWIVLILSTLVAASFAALGLTPTGIKIFFWSIPTPLNSKLMSPGDFYKTIFLYYGIGFWLSFLATALALISTASLFPDFLATGAVDLYLSKPISRIRLFLTKYLCGLLFVALQIGCFCGASFAVIGLRGGAWEPGIFLAVPIVLLFFSYMFSFCVLVGVSTRSTVAAVLLTFLLWALIRGVYTTETTLLGFKLAEDASIARLDTQIRSEQEMLAQKQRTAATQPTRQNTDYVTMYTNNLKRDRHDQAEMHSSLGVWHQALFDVETLLPKNNATIDLLDRVLTKNARLGGVAQDNDDDSKNEGADLNNNPIPVEKLKAVIRGRSVGWIISTSLAFEGVVLVLAAWIFCRRDY
ncbi:MAG TPA: hypothetical protein VGG44_01175 [Tepidisphaeraceae bacterium]